jgi:hypothetical protein
VRLHFDRFFKAAAGGNAAAKHGTKEMKIYKTPSLRARFARKRTNPSFGGEAGVTISGLRDCPPKRAADSSGRIRRRFVANSVSVLLAMTAVFPTAFAADDFRYDNHGRRDPFVSSALILVPERQMDVGELRLEGIILDPTASSYVIVNGQIVREGESLAGYALESIKANQAVFTKAGQRFELILRKDEEFIKTYLGVQSPKSKADKLKDN